MVRQSHATGERSGAKSSAEWNTAEFPLSQLVVVSGIFCLKSLTVVASGLSLC